MLCSRGARCGVEWHSLRIDLSYEYNQGYTVRLYTGNVHIVVTVGYRIWLVDCQAPEVKMPKTMFQTWPVVKCG